MATMFFNEVRISPLLKLPVFWVLLLLPLDRRERQQNPTDTSLASPAALGQLPAPLAAAEQPLDIPAVLQARRQARVWSSGAFVSGSAL